jgi:hypothetical protein
MIEKLGDVPPGTEFTRKGKRYLKLDLDSKEIAISRAVDLTIFKHVSFDSNIEVECEKRIPTTRS